jgi:hypothetical protein
MAAFKRIEDLEVYQRLCDLHIEICKVSRLPEPERRWPADS